VASNPGRISAGGRDNISVVVNTKNRGGSTLKKGFTVYTNDPANPSTRLKVTAKVKGYVSVAPKSVRLTGKVGQPLSQTIRIFPTDGREFTIKEVKAQQDQFLQYQVKPLASASGEKGYQLLVENTKTEPGSYRDTILIKTDIKQKPELRIRVYGRIRPLPDPGKKTPK
jgi:lipopolysaccharide export LptBFGC system permease protein LptF